MTPDTMIARMQERVQLRYNLNVVPGRPEELIKPGTDLAVSFAYAGRTVRVRPMVGRTWVVGMVTDFALEGGWAPKLDRLLDPFFIHVETRPLTENMVGLGDSIHSR